MGIKFKKFVSLAGLSTFKIGDKAEFFCEVSDETELKSAITFAKEHKLPYRIFAGGSNIVFPDRILKGLLIRILGNQIQVSGRKIFVGAGTPLRKVIGTAIKNGLAGLETLSGIPGTVGGAVVGNAGAYGHSISEVVKRIEILDDENRRWLNNKDCHFNYRESIFSSRGGSAFGGKNRSLIILSAELEFHKDNPKKLNKISKEIIALRLKKYKPGLRCPGSFFKNILAAGISKESLNKIDLTKIREGKIPAGYLLESVGAKGMRLGGISVAPFHGNLFINDGRAKAAEAKKLAGILKKRVFRKFGIQLEEEIRYF